MFVLVVLVAVAEGPGPGVNLGFGRGTTEGGLGSVASSVFSEGIEVASAGRMTLAAGGGGAAVGCVVWG